MTTEAKSLPNITIYYDHVLTEDEMETVTDTLIQTFDDPELLIHFSAIREDNGFYETSALVFLSKGKPVIGYLPEDHRGVVSYEYKG